MKSATGLKATFLMYTAHFCLNNLRIFYKECTIYHILVSGRLMESYSSLILFHPSLQ